MHEDELILGVSSVRHSVTSLSRPHRWYEDLVMTVHRLTTGTCTTLLNHSLLTQEDTALFDVAGQQTHKNSELGRGTVYFFHYKNLHLVIRQYQRGGAFRHLLKNQYLFTGLTRSRMWQEFHLLKTLHDQGLPVPCPIAAQCNKTSWFSYSGNLVTQTLENSHTLGETLNQKELSQNQWQMLGALIHRFHRAGVYHADLNANNILIDAQGQYYLIDFDKGRIRAPSADWQKQNINRLLRSLNKLKANQSSQFHFTEKHWQAFQAGYQIDANP